LDFLEIGLEEEPGLYMEFHGECMQPKTMSIQNIIVLRLPPRHTPIGLLDDINQTDKDQMQHMCYHTQPAVSDG
jgi:hypothetical protein